MSLETERMGWNLVSGNDIVTKGKTSFMLCDNGTKGYPPNRVKEEKNLEQKRDGFEMRRIGDDNDNMLVRG